MPKVHIELSGKYARIGSKLEGPCTLLLATRTTTTHAKGDTYVLMIAPDGKRSYVSSLWNTPVDGTYALEYGRTRYTVTMTDSTVTIVPDTGGTPMYINRGSGNLTADL